MEFKTMVLSAGISMIISLPFMIYQIKRGGYKHKGDIIIEEAEAAGRVVEGTLKWKRYAYGEPNHPDRLMREGTWFFAYQYEINGKQYTYRSNSSEMPPDTMTLYYPKGKPGKAIPRGNFVIGAKPIILILIPTFVWGLIYNILTALATK